MKALCLYLIMSIVPLTLSSQTSGDFVSVSGTDFIKDGEKYFFLGTNLWYGMNLGAADDTGDRARLTRELDRLKDLGIRNIRILGSSEGDMDSQYQVLPALQTSAGEYNEAVWKGLDFLLAEMAKRDMTAVVCLNNFWMWSGGMPQYLSWANNNEIPLPAIEKGGSWDDFINYSVSFFEDRKANGLFREHLKKVVSRTNSVTGVSYRNDPTIMAWQLANEPRGYESPRPYQKWIHKTARYLSSLDPNHLISVGSEGNTGSASAGVDLYRDNKSRFIDYATVHVWIQNWGWYDPQKPKTFEGSVKKTAAYIEDQLTRAAKLKKPMVVEEFGVSRDAASYDPAASTLKRDRYYEYIFSKTLQHAQEGGLIKGCNFWSWSGEGRPQDPGGMWKYGHHLTGDPPHERQGWYSVYDTDTSTLAIIRKYAELFNSISRPLSVSTGGAP